MGYTYSFFDNQTIGAADLNKLAKRFTSEGVADIFKDGVPYNISILNSVISANVSDGAVPETDTSLKVFISNSKDHIEDNEIKFQKLEQERDVLRKIGFNVEIEMQKRKLKKSLEYANKEKIAYVIIVGENEIINKKITVKDMFNNRSFDIELDKIELLQEVIK